MANDLSGWESVSNDKSDLSGWVANNSTDNSNAPSDQDRFNYAMDKNRTPVDMLRDIAAGAIGTLGKGGQLIASTLTGGKAPTVDFNSITNSIASPNHSQFGDIARSLSSYAPMAAIAGPGLAANSLGAGATGFINADPKQSNFFGLLPNGRVGSAIENAGASFGMGKLFDNLFPQPTQSVNQSYAPTYTMPSSQSQFTNVPYQKPSFLSNDNKPISEDLAKNIHSQIIGNKSSEDAGKSLAGEISNKYGAIKDYFKNEYNKIFNKNSSTDFPMSEDPIKTKDLLLNDSNYLKNYRDYDFSDNNLQKLHDNFLDNSTIGNAHKFQSELGSEIGYLKKQNGNGVLDSKGKNLLSDYSNMRDQLKDDMVTSMDHHEPGLGEKYNDVTNDWNKYVIPFHSDKDLKQIAEGKIKNPIASQVVSIFKNPESNINQVSSTLSQDAKNNIVQLGMGKNQFQNSANDMIGGHNAVYSKGLNQYLDPYHEGKLQELRSSVQAEKEAANRQAASDLLSNQLKAAHESAAKESAQQSKNAFKQYELAKKETDELIKKNPFLEIPDKYAGLKSMLRSGVGIGVGALLGGYADKASNSLLGSYMGRELMSSIKKKVNK